MVKRQDTRIESSSFGKDEELMNLTTSKQRPTNSTKDRGALNDEEGGLW